MLFVLINWWYGSNLHHYFAIWNYLNECSFTAKVSDASLTAKVPIKESQLLHNASICIFNTIRIIIIKLCNKESVIRKCNQCKSYADYLLYKSYAVALFQRDSDLWRFSILLLIFHSVNSERFGWWNSIRFISEFKK